MPSYWRLKNVKPPAQRRRVITSLEKLRKKLREELPHKRATDSLILGTWNLRNFDDNRFGDGPRLPESFWYIAEMISAFDIVAIQEVCDDLVPLDEVMSLMDPAFDYIITDVTEGPSGNKERLGFVYNSDKVKFKGVAGEVVLPYRNLISDVTKKRQFARTPFSCAFQSGWFEFMFSTVHIYYGKQSKSSPAYQRRVNEIDGIAKFLAKRADKDKRSHILVGDFNIEDFEGKTFDALNKNGFEVFKNKVGSNSDQTKFYDQISFKARDGHIELAPVSPPRTMSHGVFNFFDCVYTTRGRKPYEKTMRATLTKKIEAGKKSVEKAQRARARATTATAIAKADKKLASARKSVAALRALKKPAGLPKYFKKWRTFQLSDHMPLWVELEINFSTKYLDRLKQ